jgi:hypothetical protein
VKIEYFPDTDSLSIDLASKHLDLRTLDLRSMPFEAQKVAG